jgi:hypothetical protein
MRPFLWFAAAVVALLLLGKMKVAMAVWPLALSVYLFWSFVAALIGAN